MTAGETLSGVRRVLSLPSVYEAAQNFVGAERFRRTVTHEYLRPTESDKVLDIGCGTADIVDHLPHLDYVGFDHSERYVKRAVQRFGDRGQFVAGTWASEQLRHVDARTLAMAIGVLHHLDDQEALATLRLARSLLGPAGRFIAVDPTLVKGQSVFAAVLARMDRGQNVRSPQATRELAEQVFDVVDVQVRHDLLRVPYSHVVLSAIAQ